MCPPSILVVSLGEASGTVPILQMGRFCLEVRSSVPKVTQQEGGRVGIKIQGS